MNENKTTILKHRVIALLTREQMEFIEKLSMDSMFSTGHKLPKTDIIAALVDAAIQMDVKAVGVANRGELVQQILESQSQSAERREYPRLKKALLIGVRKADSMGEYKDQMTKNVSLGGLMIEVGQQQERYEVNQIIELTIKENELFKVLGRVTWLKENKEKSRWEIGVQLIYIKEEDLQRMRSLLSGGFND